MYHNSKTSKRLLTRLIVLLVILVCAQYILTGVYIGKEMILSVSAATETENTQSSEEDPNKGEYLRLSNVLTEDSIPYRRESYTRYDRIRINQDSNGNKLAVKMEGVYYPFDYGIWAHASSELYYDISEYSEKYPYLTLYMGINQTSNAGNGVKVWIYTSDKDQFYTSGAQNWTQKNAETDSNRVIMPGQNAVFEKVDIRGAKYLRIQAYDNGSNGNDHIVYINPMLITENYKEDNDTQIKTIAEYNEMLKDKNANDIISGEYELTLLQRELVKKAGEYALKRFLSESDENKEMLSWLMNDVDVLRYYILGGTPDGGSYYNSLKQLTRLYTAYKEDFKIEETTRYGTVLGDLYTRMAIALSLTHSQRVALWMQPGAAENQSDAVTRYQIFKDMHKDGHFIVTKNADGTPNIDITKWFESYCVEEMRFVMNNLIDDEEILWLNEYTQAKIDSNPRNAWGLLTPHSYMAYVAPNYGNPIYYTNDEYFNELFSVNGKKLWDYGISKGDINHRLNKVWMNFRNKFGTGAVCGGISKTGSNIRTSHGIPAAVIGQPGHAAIIYYTQDANGNGYWNLDNDVSGWTRSEKGERLLIGWGNANTNYARGSYQVVYMALAQEALNDYENFEKCEKYVMLADVYTDNLAKKEEMYRKALEIQSINLDAWLGLINLYNVKYNSNETDPEKAKEIENAYYDLAKEMAESLKYFPLPMQQLTNLIKPKLKSIENAYRFTLLQTRILTEGTSVPNNTADKYYVYQPSLTRLEANFLLGNLDKTIATFSFDGENAGKIVLANRFNGIGVRWDYCIDGHPTEGLSHWKEVSFTAEEEHKLQLTPEEIRSLTAENDIYIHIVGVGYEEENLYKIDIQESAGLPSTIYGSDLENRVLDVNLTTEWRYTENDDWTKYSEGSPDLTGDKTVQLRQGATGTRLASKNPVTFTFTKDTDPDTRKYIPVSHLTLAAVSTEAVNNGGAARYAIDANLNTRWHSAWNGTDTQRYITVKLDKPVFLSAVEFVPAGGGNGKILDGTIYGSTDGENWTVLASRKNLRYTNKTDTIAQAKANTQNFEISDVQEVQYVKIVADNASTGNNMSRNGNWFAARAFNFYQDLTKNPHPTAGIGYSTTEKTNEAVIARLINPSTNITITNNDGKDTYVFTENGSFTFEFEDEQGREGTATAKVDWIDKKGPDADVKYKLGDDKKLIAILDNISEDVYLLDENNNKTNYIEVANGKVISISFYDEKGEVYKVSEVDENRVTTKITYKNTTGNVDRAEYYLITLDNGKVLTRTGIDEEGNSITLTDSEIEALKSLEEMRSNPLEFYLEAEQEYEFKLLDKASNMTTKNVKVDYIENDTKIIASDITYSTTVTTNQDVVATVRPYIIDMNGKNSNAEIVNNDKKTTYTFKENGEFTFEYAESKEVEGLDREVVSHTAKVDWIDKTAPTAEIQYSTTQNTDKVVVTLTNESEEIIITNNGGKREYTFTKNGEFVFEFQDKAGNKGTAKATVNNISVKGDINGNGEVDIDDLAKLKLHLIGIKILEDAEMAIADMDGDGEPTINDLAQMKLELIK